MYFGNCFMQFISQYCDILLCSPLILYPQIMCFDVSVSFFLYQSLNSWCKIGFFSHLHRGIVLLPFMSHCLLGSPTLGFLCNLVDLTVSSLLHRFLFLIFPMLFIRHLLIGSTNTPLRNLEILYYGL